MWLVTVGQLSVAQTSYHIDQSIPVEVNGKNLTLPWAGGLNSSQVNTIDLDQDGKDDLAIFDRTANKIFTFINSGNKYVYNPEYESLFPSTIDQWVLLRDFNCDGRKDLFTSDPAGISVFVNTTQKGQNVRWRPFNPGHPLLTIGFNGSINLKVNATDIPAIDDIDDDGDLDILVALFAGAGTIEYHRNMSIENTGRCDSMQFVRVTTEWGNFEECSCGRFAFGGIDCSQVPDGRTLHDEGKSMLTLDLTNDGLRDLIFSEEDCTSLYLLPNEGTINNAQMNKSGIFPDSNPATLLFPAGFYEDMDFDGVKDLLVSSNVSASVATAMDLSNSNWLYKNIGTTKSPQLSLQKTNWLQDQMIDVGSYASPAFADFDNDGDQDLFVSYWAGVDTTASIFLYENIGSYNNPSFKYITNDYLQFLSFGFFNVKIQFFDFNADGKLDLVFTGTDKKNYETHLYILKNKNNQVFDFSDQVPEEISFSFDQPDNILIQDINRDGLPDILIGKTNGSLQYWNNIGSAHVPRFYLANPGYSGVTSSFTRYCVFPRITDLDSDGKQDLLIGNKGTVVAFRDFRSGSSVADTLMMYNSIKQISENRKLGNQLALATADLYSNGSPVLATGLITGGIYMLRSDSVFSERPENEVLIWPNPAGQGQQINIRTTHDAHVDFFNVLGQRISDTITVAKDEHTLVDQVLSSGLYFVKVSWSGGSKTVKLVVR